MQRRTRRRIPAGNGGADRARAWLGELKLGKGIHHHNVTIYPVVGRPCDPVCVLLDQAIGSGMVEVGEVDDHGSVPEIRVHNRGKAPVLAIEGEILVGAKQNRVVNVTTIIAPGARMDLPVSCVEQGRWHHVSRHFQSRHHAPPRLRAKKVRSVQENRTRIGTRHSNQGEVWQDVACYIDDAGVASPTMSLLDAYAGRKSRLDAMREALVLPEGSQGFIVGSGEAVLGMDVFDSQVTMNRMWDRLAEGYLIEAAGDDRKRKRTLKRDARAFWDGVIAGIEAADLTSPGAVELAVVGSGLTGTGVMYQGNVCHVAAFPV